MWTLGTDQLQSHGHRDSTQHLLGKILLAHVKYCAQFEVDYFPNFSSNKYVRENRGQFISKKIVSIGTSQEKKAYLPLWRWVGKGETEPDKTLERT